MKRAKITAELMRLHAELGNINVIRGHLTEKSTLIRPEEFQPQGNSMGVWPSEANSLCFRPPRVEDFVAMCITRVPRVGRLGKRWTGPLARRLPSLSGRKVTLSEAENCQPSPPDPVAPVIREAPSPSLEPERPTTTQAPETGQFPEKKRKAAPSVPRRKREAVDREVAVVEESPPKPLKVIRRRREEAPKVFETPPKTVPLAMLEGITVGPDDDAGM